MHISKHSFFSSQFHGRLPDEDMSKHSHEKRALTLKTTVGGPAVHMSKHSHFLLVKGALKITVS